MEAYCVKCKEKRAITRPEPTFTKAGTPATTGICGTCGTKLFRMGRTAAHEGMKPPEVVLRSNKSKKKIKARKGKLVIVESPAKARTVDRYLGKNYKVKASVGHVRDLLRSKLSVDVENNFEPRYRVPNEKRDIVKALIADVAAAEEVILATDPDREGEAIAWHLMEATGIEPERARRVVFHEITKSAIEEAFLEPSELNMRLVNAQQGRRVLDRLVGYNLSPLLWRKVRGRLSAGRVQSVALRLVVDREKEIFNFEPQEYWSVDAEFLNKEKPPVFKARLVQIASETPQLETRQTVEQLVSKISTADYKVSKVKRGSRRRKPSAPFTTSTMQQDASRSLKYTARRTMVLAQQLYEGIDVGDDGLPTGLITYMRTDSVQVSKQAQAEARDLIRKAYGEAYLPETTPEYKTKTRRAQEAHEAIRPTSAARTPAILKPMLSKDQFKLYSLIWKRFIASQMNPAVFDTLIMEVDGTASEVNYLFRVTASALKFAGFLEVYEESKSRATIDEKVNREKIIAQMEQLPDLVEGDEVNLVEIFPEQHFTQPPPRFSDASLIKSLEEHGIGRPSTYAPILTTIQQRGYVERHDRRLFPTEIGTIVNDLLVDHFPNIVDTGFTANMEKQLDEIADGKREWVDVIRSFYGPFAKQVALANELMPEVKTEPEQIGRDCSKCGHPLIIRYGRFGKFIGCSNFPECRYTEPWLEKIGVKCPKCSGEIVQRKTRKGRLFYGCENYPECDFNSWKRPLKISCPECKGLLVTENRTRAACLDCSSKFLLEELGSELEDGTETATV